MLFPDLGRSRPRVAARVRSHSYFRKKMIKKDRLNSQTEQDARLTALCRLLGQSPRFLRCLRNICLPQTAAELLQRRERETEAHQYMAQLFASHPSIPFP